MSAVDDAPLGLVLHQDATWSVQIPAEPAARDARVIGYLHDPAEAEIVELTDDGSVAVLTAQGELHPLNGSREQLDEFVAAFAEYLDSGPRPTPPTVLSAAEAAEKLAQFRAGEIKPRPAPMPERSHRDRVRRLRRRLVTVEKPALKPGSWWHAQLEQARDDLI
ncbi:hypothetical protein [Promicromonospora kroppenstedtii]|uniref:hypothetical protein n=1 Tax=Promicromonospora kroppenstedtii TaxID=440482 RepID=UPI0004B4F718|nr:hypothetical protein [Promicromonospora kroppenstedtii]